MGIRIHKILGYGLIDVEHGKHDIADGRFTKKFINSYKTYPDVWKFEDYKKWLQKFSDFESRFEVASLQNLDSDISRCFVYDGEYGDPNVFMVIPPAHRGNWYRYDDIIDYYEESVKNGSVNWHKHLNYGIYPYSSAFMDSRTGRRVKHSTMLGQVDKKVANEVAKKDGFASYDDAKKYIAPEVPKCVELVCKFCKVFRTQKTILQLRPMLYTYWS